MKLIFKQKFIKKQKHHYTKVKIVARGHDEIIFSIKINFHYKKKKNNLKFKINFHKRNKFYSNKYKI